MTEAKSKKQLLILGSGFSKAVSEKMPTVRELAEALKQQINEDPELKDLEDPKYQHLLNDPELLLTYLAQDQPWKKSWEALKERALFLRISKWLAEQIEQCEDQAFGVEIPEWTKRLAKWLNETKAWVITFNYDTVLERACWLYLKEVKPQGDHHAIIFNSYRIPLAPIQSRIAAVLGDLEDYMFDLVKLHGSINWFYSGLEEFPGEQIYCRLVNSKSPYKDDYVSERSILWGVSQEVLKMLLSDRINFIIPPVAEKSRFYSNRTVRSLWGKARDYLQQAEEIYVIGYSLPDTDLTTKLLLQTACVGKTKTVYIVNNNVKGKENLLRRYKDAFPEGTIVRDDYIRPDAVEAMVNDLCKEVIVC
ncbi:MAG: hypothetical protein NZO41_00485 [Candidatus Bipolaricaulota bacterium]|nr:hypothetical protein [Candidatus Bipolaricaulota bacterium]MDW8140745.1 hypothetical protein [Candidatus Bipolaricaulota bacterium]